MRRYEDPNRNGSPCDNMDYFHNFINDLKPYLYYFQNKDDSYVGEYKDGLYHGQGVLVIQNEERDENGDRYEGEFKNGLQHGEFIVNFSNGATYKGGFKYG
mgnify:CR=1 FL=1